MQQPFTRLNCHCIFTERAKNLDASLTLVENAVEKKHLKEAITEIRKEVQRLKEDYKIHIEEHNKDYMRSMLDLSKNRVLNPIEVDGTLLQTSAWKTGDVNRLRNPVKKRTKKEEAAIKKKANKKQKLKKEK